MQMLTQTLIVNSVGVCSRIILFLVSSMVTNFTSNPLGVGLASCTNKVREGGNFDQEIFVFTSFLLFLQTTLSRYYLHYYLLKSY